MKIQDLSQKDMEQMLVDLSRHEGELSMPEMKASLDRFFAEEDARKICERTLPVAGIHKTRRM